MDTKKGIINRFIDFVRKDTGAVNEPKKITVIVRVLLLSYIVYYAINILLCGVMYMYFQSMALFVLYIVACLVMFAMTYRGKTSVTLWGFVAVTLVCVVSYVHFLGWNTGVQHFLMILLILYFFSKYKNYGKKIIFAVAVTIFRLFMFRFYYMRTPEIVLLSGEITTLQVINTVMIFWCISFICFVCSESSQELEGKLLEYNAILEKQATEDALTGLYNRRKGRDLLEAVSHNAEMAEGCCVSIADIDYFKKVNDTYGHDAGDEVLKTLANLFQSEMRRRDFAIRWGGEEFLFVFFNCSGDEACAMLEELRKKVQDTVITANGQEIKVTMTFGLTEFLQQDDVDATLKAADEKLYRGKEEGRNRIIY
nr:diguanylate cyclase [Lachnospiraceae bacterium]